MDKELSEKMAEVNTLAEEYRVRCLWFLREDYYPATPAEACRVLEYIERNGDATAFRRAATLRQWLLERVCKGPQSSRRANLLLIKFIMAMSAIASLFLVNCS